MSSRLHLRQTARWLIAVLAFSLLHPAIALGLSKAGGNGGAVQICTAAGMVWLRDANAPAQAPGAVEARATEDVAEPGPGDAPSAPAHCPLCAGAALAADAPDAEGQPVPWPALRPLARENPPSFAPCSARVLLDAPMRGPPRAPQPA